MERCRRGRTGVSGEHVTRKGSWVRIPPSPPMMPIRTIGVFSVVLSVRLQMGPLKFFNKQNLNGTKRAECLLCNISDKETKSSSVIITERI